VAGQPRGRFRVEVGSGVGVGIATARSTFPADARQTSAVAAIAAVFAHMRVSRADCLRAQSRFFRSMFGTRRVPATPEN
jgi:hypothetical protein